MSSLLSARDLRVLSSDGLALSPVVNLELSEGEVLFLRGENGAGKSTLLKTLLGLHKYFEGSFQFSIPQKDIQYLPQLGTLHFHLPMTLRDLLGDNESSHSLLKNMDLNKKWNTASGGERQKILLSAVLKKKPRLLILDEPFNHVDSESTQQLEEALGTYLKENPQSSLILVSHRALTAEWNRVRILEIR